jgi:putative ABC transport system permease protein
MNPWRRRFSRQRWERDMSEELRSHIDQQTAANIGAGMTPQEARRQAALQFGALEGVKEGCREQRRGFWLESLWADMRYGLRALRRNSGFAAVAILTLALGIGGTTSVFSVVDRILFRPLPYPHAERLLSVGMLAPLDSNEFMFASSYVGLREHPAAFDSVTSFTAGMDDCDLVGDAPVRLACARVASTFLSTFEIHPLLGRDFSAEEDRPNAPGVALMSYGIWKNRFARDPHVVGKTITLDGHTVTIIGILPAEFEFPTLARVDFLVPQALNETAWPRGAAAGPIVRAFARLKPGVTPSQAAASLQPWFDELISQAPPQFRNEIRLAVRPLRDRQIGDARLASWVLLGAVFAVLLIACTNVANLLLVRATGRRQEFAVRAALGAARGRLIRQTLTESVLLGLLGGAAGLLLGYVLLRAFIAISPEGILRLREARLDFRVLVFTFAAAIASAIFFGLASAPPGPAMAFLHGGRAAGSKSRGLLRLILASAQIAVSIVLLVGAGLLLRSLWNLEKVPLGMRTENVVTASIALGDYRYSKPAQQFEFFEDLEARVQRIPGVSASAISDSIPPAGAMHSMPFTAVEVAGHPRYMKDTGGMVGWRSVTPGYFSVLDVLIVRGRGFEEADRAANQNVVIVSSALAHKLFPYEDALGKSLRFGLTGPWFTIVGVAANVKNAGIVENDDPEYYLARKLTPDDAWDHSTVMIRSALSAPQVADWMRREIAELDPTLPFTIETMRQRVSKLEQRPRFDAALLALFAGMGVLLAAIGVYGVIAFLATERTREIGVRMALGAQPRDIRRLVMRDGIKLLLVGSVAGTIAAAALTRWMESLLFGVAPNDPVTFMSVIALLAAVAIAACYVPARRAMHVDPMVALRYE